MLSTLENELKILVNLAAEMRWNFVSLIFDQNHQDQASVLRQELKNQGICMAKFSALEIPRNLASETMSLTKKRSMMEHYQILVRKLVLATGSRALYLFASSENVLKFLNAILLERVPSGRFLVILR